VHAASFSQTRESVAYCPRVKPAAAASADEPVAAVKFDGFDQQRYVHALETLGTTSDPVGVYIHIPFCPVRCLYCGCHTTITHDGEQIDRYIDALEREMDLVVAASGCNRPLFQLHFGGGTPNYLSASQLGRLVNMVGDRFQMLGETDATIECNPRRTSPGQLELLRGLGFRRLSLGVQDLEPAVQRTIGRVQSLHMLQDIYWMAREIGFESINFDLVYGLPNQTERSFQNTLEQVVDLAPDRVTCFSYNHTPSCHPHQHAMDFDYLPSELDRMSLFNRAVETLTGAGYVWVGLDRFALDTDEWAIAQDERRLHRNCIGYTGAVVNHVLAFGPSSVGQVSGGFFQNIPPLSQWQETLEQGQFPVMRGRLLSESEQTRRQAIIQLICNLELPVQQASEALGLEYTRLSRYAEHGFLEMTPDLIRLTSKGRFFMRDLFLTRLAGLEWDNIGC